MSTLNRNSQVLSAQKPGSDPGHIAAEKENAVRDQPNRRGSPEYRGMFDRVRRDRERMPGDTQTKHGGPDMRTQKKKGFTAQLTWREKPAVVDQYKLTAHGLGMTLSEYALTTHYFREQYAVLQAVLEQLSKEAKAAGVPLVRHVQGRLRIGRHESGSGGTGAVA